MQKKRSTVAEMEKMDMKKVPLPEKSLLEQLDLPGDLKKLDMAQCQELCQEIRNLLIETVSKTGGHLASNLGAVELTVAMHRVFTSDRPAECVLYASAGGRNFRISKAFGIGARCLYQRAQQHGNLRGKRHCRGHASAGGSGALRHCSHRRRRNDRRAGV